MAKHSGSLHTPEMASLTGAEAWAQILADVDLSRYARESRLAILRLTPIRCENELLELHAGVETVSAIRADGIDSDLEAVAASRGFSVHIGVGSSSFLGNKSRGIRGGGQLRDIEDPDVIASAWTRVQQDLTPPQRLWTINLRFTGVRGSVAHIQAPDEFTRRKVLANFGLELRDGLSRALGVDVTVEVTVDRSLSYLDNNAEPDEPERPSEALLRTSAHADPARLRVLETRLNPRYVFDTFVIGSSNRFAHAAAVAVAEAPGKNYNPLLIYGDSGLGKSHLLHAIGHYARSLFAGARVRYVSSEEFTHELEKAMRDGQRDRFEQRYRDVDVLLIDDIQFLEGKIQTQEEFFHTFNTLHNANKQIVLTSDRAPKRLEALEDRLRNRFEWGLITDVQPPDLETRIAILRKKAATERMTAPPDVLEFIASKIQTNIRELEGALIRVTAFASLNRQPVDLTLAEIVLKDLIPEGGEPEITAALIIAQTAAYFALSIDDLCGASRSRVLVTGRQIAMYLCRELTDMTLPEIGRELGNRDAATILHGVRKIEQLLAERHSVYNQVTELTSWIKYGAGNDPSRTAR